MFKLRSGVWTLVASGVASEARRLDLMRDNQAMKTRFLDVMRVWPIK